MTALDAADELTSMVFDIKQQDVMRKPIGNNQFLEKVTNKTKLS